MKAIKNRKWYLAARHVSFILLGAGLLSVTACNNSSKTKTDKTDTTSARDDNAKTADITKDKMFTVRITADNFRTIFESNSGGNDVQMVYLEFDGTRYSEGFALKAIGATKTGEPVSGTEVQLDKVDEGTVLAYAGGVEPPEYAQAVTRGHIKDFFALPTRTETPIDGKKFNEVWLTPCFKPGTDTIYYQVNYPPGAADPIPACPSVIGKNAAGLIVTNPSPPENPCNAACDDPQFMFKPKWK